MKNEINGVITKVYDEENGVIKGEDGNLYQFSKIDFLHNFNFNINDKVCFKPQENNIKGYVIYKAILISKI